MEDLRRGSCPASVLDPAPAHSSPNSDIHSFKQTALHRIFVLPYSLRDMNHSFYVKTLLAT